MSPAQPSRQILFCFPNADAGSHSLIARVHAFCAAHPTARVFTNLPAITYWSLLREASLLLGNSSSGIMEAASFHLPVVNIGLRQFGRERAANVLDANPDSTSILEALARAQSAAFRASLVTLTNPYGDGHAAERIVHVLTSTPLSPLLRKRAQPVA